MCLSLPNAFLTALISLALLSAPLTGSEIRVWGPATSCPEVLTVPPGLTDVVQIAGGMRHIVALKADGTVVAWGKNNKGQLNVPVGLTGVTKLIVGFNSNMAIKANGTFVVWGENFFGQLSVPDDISEITNGTVSLFDSVAVLPDGTLRQWGTSATGVLPIVASAREAGIEGGLGFVRLADHSVQMWSSASQPDGREAAFAMPVGLQAKRLIGPFGEIVLAITTTGKLECWGWDAPLVAAAPTSLIASNVKDAAIGSSHILAIKNDGTLITWTSTPADTVGLAIPTGWSGPSHIACGFQFNVALWTTHAPNGSAPNNISLSAATVAEGTQGGVLIGTLAATDGDPGDTHNFSLVNGNGDINNSIFEIVGSSLSTIQPIPSGVASLSLRVKAIDSGGSALEKELKVPVTLSSAPVSNNEKSDSNKKCGLGSAGIVMLFCLFFRLRRTQR